MDPIMLIVLKAGVLTLRELFARAGTELGTRLRIASLLKSGDVRLEAIEGSEDVRNELKKLLTPNLSDEALAQILESHTEDKIAEGLEIAPTVKAWRKPMAAL